MKECDYDEILKYGIIDHLDTKRTGKDWGITWFNHKRLDPSDLKDIYNKILFSPNVIEFVLQLEDCPYGNGMHIHAVIRFRHSDVKPVPNFRKLFPGVQINKVKQYEMWQSFCSKDYSRVPGTETLFYNVNPALIIPYKDYCTSLAGRAPVLSKEDEEKKMEEAARIKFKKKEIEKRVMNELKLEKDPAGKAVHENPGPENKPKEEYGEEKRSSEGPVTVKCSELKPLSVKIIKKMSDEDLSKGLNNINGTLRRVIKIKTKIEAEIQERDNMEDRCSVLLVISTNGRTYNIKMNFEGIFKELSWKSIGVEGPIIVKSKESIHLPVENESNAYLLWNEGTTYYKIGFSERVFDRIEDFKTGNPPNVNLICLACCPGGKTSESFLHTKFDKNRCKNQGRGKEWFIFEDTDLEAVIREYVIIRFEHKNRKT